MRTFIAFTGVKGSGKTTAFEFIKEAYPAVIEVTIAAKLKQVCSDVFEIPRSWFDDPAVKEKELAKPVYLTQENISKVIQGFGHTPNFDKQVRQHIGMFLESPRRVAQYIGTEVLRTVSENIHCEGAILGLPEEGTFIVTDMRFPNEFNFFSQTLGSFFPIYIANYAAESKLGPNSHASELFVLELAKLCERIDNNGSKDELKTAILNKVIQITNR